MTRRVVITGVGAVTPLGVGARAADRRAGRAGESGIADGVGRCREFDPLDFLSTKEARRADRFTQFAIVAGRRGARARPAAASELPYDPHRVGCVIGTGIGGLGTLEREQRQADRAAAPKAVSPLAVPLMMGNAAAAAVSMRHGLRGHVLRRRLGLRGRRPRDRRRRADDPAPATPTRSSPAAPRRRSPALATAAFAAHGRDLARAASRARSTPAATAS